MAVWQSGSAAIRSAVDAWLAWDDGGGEDEGNKRDEHPDAEVLVASRHRRIVRLAIDSDIADGSIIVKEFRESGAGDPIARILLSRIKRWIGFAPADREWQALVRLHDAGVACPVPLGRATLPGGKSLIAMQFVPGSSCENILAIPGATRRSLLERIGALVQSLHRAGEVHTDLHIGNVLWGDTGTVLIDWQRARRDTSDRARLADIASFDFSLAHLGVSRGDRMRFCMRALGLKEMRSPLAREQIRSLARAGESRAREYYRGRTRRLTQTSAEHVLTRLSGMSGLRLARFSQAALEEALTEHDRAVEGGDDRVLKSDHRSRVSGVMAQGTPVIVKQVVKGSRRKWLADAFRGSPGRRAWCAGHGLALRGIDAATPLAFLELRRMGIPTTSFVVLEDLRPALPAATLPPQSEGGPASALLAERLCDLAIRLHRRAVTHGDLQAFHILVSPGEQPATMGRVTLIDLEGVRFCAKLSEEERLQALAQLNASLADELASPDDRLRAFARYHDALPFQMGRDAALAQIVERSLARKHRWRGVGC